MGSTKFFLFRYENNLGNLILLHSSITTSYRINFTKVWRETLQIPSKSILGKLFTICFCFNAKIGWLYIILYFREMEEEPFCPSESEKQQNWHVGLYLNMIKPVYTRRCQFQMPARSVLATQSACHHQRCPECYC